MTELEELLRADLHRAAQSVEIPVSIDAIVAEHERQRRVRAVILVAGVGAAAAVLVLALALIVLPAVTKKPELQATVDPRTAPSATSTASLSPTTAPTPSPIVTGSATQSVPAEASSTALSLPAIGGRPAVKVAVKSASNGSGLVFSDASGRSVTVDRAEGINWTPDAPSPGFGVGVLPAEAVWAGVLPTGDPGSWPVTQVVVTKVPGSDLVAVAFRYETGTIAFAPPSLVWGRANGAVYDGSQRVPSLAWSEPQGDRVAFVVDQRKVWGTRDQLRGVVSGSLTSGVVANELSASSDTQFQVVGVLPPGASTENLVFEFPWQASLTAPLTFSSDTPQQGEASRLFRGTWTRPATGAAAVGTAYVTYTDASGQRVRKVLWQPS